MKKLVSLFLGSVIATQVLFAGGGGGGGAKEHTQIAQYKNDQAKWAADYVKQIAMDATTAEQLVQDLETVRMMTQNLEDLKGVDFTSFAQSLMKLKKLNANSNGITYAMSNLDEMFRKTYKGFDEYYKEQIESEDGIEVAENFSTYLQNITNNTNDTIKSTLDKLGMDESDFRSESTILSKLQADSQSARGNKAVIQAANNIAIFQAEQLRKLRDTMNTQINLQAQFMAAQNEKDAVRNAELKAFRRDTQKYEEKKNLSLDELVDIFTKNKFSGTTVEIKGDNTEVNIDGGKVNVKSGSSIDDE